MKSSLHFSLEILPKNNDEGKQAEKSERGEHNKRPTIFSMIKMQSYQRTDNRDEDKIDEGEHIVLLCFQVGKEQHNATQKSTKANNWHNKKGKAMHQQKVNRYQ